MSEILENNLELDVNLRRLDDLFTVWIKNTFKDIKKSNGFDSDVIFSTGTRWAQVNKQKDNNTQYSTIIIKRKPDVKPNDKLFLYKSFDHGCELYRKINKEQSNKVGSTVLDIAFLKPPTFINIYYDVVLFDQLITNANVFQEILLNTLQKTSGYIKDNLLYFDIFYENSLDESNILQPGEDNKKVIVGATFRLEGYFISKNDVKIVQSSARTRIDVKEQSFKGETLDSVLTYIPSIQPPPLNGDSYFELLFDGSDEYNLPLVLTGDQDFYISLDFYLGNRTTLQNIFTYYNSVGLNGISLLCLASTGRFQFNVSSEDGNSISLQTTSNITGLYYNIKVEKIGNIFSLYKNNLLSASGSLTSSINFSTCDYAQMSESGSNILNGNKIKNWKGLWAIPIVNGGRLAWQDINKTIPASNNQQVAVIETPDGDIIQNDINKMAKSLIPAS